MDLMSRLILWNISVAASPDEYFLMMKTMKSTHRVQGELRNEASSAMHGDAERISVVQGHKNVGRDGGQKTQRASSEIGRLGPS